jgi:ATP-dependent helicase HepA
MGLTRTTDPSQFRRPLRGGMIVRSRLNTVGPGKVVGTNGDKTIVEYFHSPGRQSSVELLSSSLTRVPLEVQMRCYLFSEQVNRWVVGRITAKSDGDYQVDLPDGRSVYVPEPVVYVRCNDVADPMETLAVRGYETAFYHAPRTNFLRSLVRQRAAFRGLTALASAGVEFYPHQVEIVRRVLEDPIQRYLLADEVGLGKTIEAGILIRQYLIDEPLGRAVIIAPPNLVQQWLVELSGRFQLDVTDSARVHLAGNLPEIAEEEEIGMLVVDEAHNLAASAFSSDKAARQQFALLAALAHRTERLLLLSATPAPDHEQQFLAMLHLLDPNTYHLEGLDEFNARLERRQAVGRLLLAIQEDADPFALKRSIARLNEVVPSDPILNELSKTLLSIVDHGPQDETNTVIRQIRAHIGEIYRIHRRMLRSRRSELGGVLSARGPTDGNAVPTILEVPDRRVLEAHDLIDDWRASAVDLLLQEDRTDDGPLRSREVATLRLLQLLLECTGTSLTRLTSVIRERLGHPFGTSSLLTPHDMDIVAAVPEFEGERDTLQKILAVAERSSEEIDQGRVLAQFLRSLRQQAGIRPVPKCTVFASDSEVARKLTEQLTTAFGQRAVASISGGAMHVASELMRFRQERDCFIFVSDRTGEEGINLQFATYLVLLDLPWSPNQIEQRIGRLDRIGRTQPVHTVVFLPKDASHSIYAAWIELLRDGLGIFSESVASLQFFLDARLPLIERAMLYDGATGLQDLVDGVKTDALEEKRRLREQSALDEIDASTEHATRFFAEMDNLDAEGAAIRTAFEGWACGVLDLQRMEGMTDTIVRYSSTNRTKVPSTILRQVVTPHLNNKCTFNRATASSEVGVSMMRIGNGLIDGLQRYLDWDDRGSTYAIWRHETQLGEEFAEEWLGFRLHYLIEADLKRFRYKLVDAGLPAFAWHALQRRADAVLPPSLIPLYFDVNGQEVTNAALLDVLKRPFVKATEGGRDYNLHKQNLKALDDVISLDQWELSCRTVRISSETALRTRESFLQRVKSAVGEVERRATIEKAQLAARSGNSTTSSAAGETDLLVRNVVNEVLLEAVRSPSVRLNSVGFLVVSRHKSASLAASE